MLFSVKESLNSTKELQVLNPSTLTAIGVARQVGEVGQSLHRDGCTEQPPGKIQNTVVVNAVDDQPE
jgi:hypothetical protein